MEDIRLMLTFIILFSMDLIKGSKYTGKLLVVSFDGFRWDYTKYTDTPNFDSFEKYGTRVKYMNGVFPTKTFPSHVSIATGLHPESHGIVGNYMYDRELNQHFSPRKAAQPHWWTSNQEPIWVTAKKQGLKTAVYFWLGSTVEGQRPDHWLRFNSSHPFEHRADRVVHWFKDKDVDLAMLYFDEPDETGHNTGTPEKSRDTVKMIRDCDRKLGYLMTQLAKENLMESVNILVLSDHGMADIVSPDSIIHLPDYLNMDDIQVFGDDGTLANILPKPGREEAVYQSLVGKHPNMTVYRRENMPQRFHFQNHPRIHPILVVPDEGWIVAENATLWRSWKQKGLHGYDNRLLSMKPYFRAMGPNIKKNFENPVFHQTDVYSLMCEILGIEPAPNNGSLDVIGQMLLSFEDKVSSASSDVMHAQWRRTNEFLVFILVSLLTRTLFTSC